MVQDRVFGRYVDLAAVFVTGVYAVLAVLIAGARTASAAPTPLASTYDRLVTDDGWKVELRASELVVNPMANIANNFASREGRVSARSRASSGCGYSWDLGRRTCTRHSTRPCSLLWSRCRVEIACRPDCFGAGTVGVKGAD